MGIRPENIHDEERFLAACRITASSTAKVEVVELMGSETYLYLSSRTARTSNIVARVDPRTTSRAGDTVKVAFDVEPPALLRQG